MYSVGEIETFGELLNSNPNAKLTSGNSGSWVLFRGSVKPSRQQFVASSAFGVDSCGGSGNASPELTEAV